MGDEPVLRKAANALVPSAEPTPSMLAALNSAFLGFGRQYLNLLRSRAGGLWVGGVLEIFHDRVRFTPNALNEMVQTGDLSQEIAMRDVRAVQSRFGIITGIVDIIHGEICSSFRCYGSKRVAAILRTLIAS